jgi:Tfp pilus assembly protein PilX
MTQRLPRIARGAAALAVSMILLFTMTIGAFYANRGTIFEQRTATNQLRSTKAFEMADAGVEWALGRLNDGSALQAAPSCERSTAANSSALQSFRERYLAPVANSGFSPNSTYRSGCSVAADGATTCSCVTSGTPTFGNSTDPRFAVQFVASPAGDPRAVEIISYGCTGGSTCAPNAAGAFDAEAVVRVLIKVVPVFPSAPGAGLVTGFVAVTGGNMNVINDDPRSNGVTINSGSIVELTGSTQVTSLPGVPPTASILDNDPSLATITNDEAFFASFFGKSTAAYQADSSTYFIVGAGQCAARPTGRCSECGNASDCGSKVSAAIDGPSKALQFWIDRDVQFSNGNLPTAGTLGTASKPVTIAGTSQVELKSSLTAYGMFYAQTAATSLWDYEGSGTAKVFGAFVSRGGFNKGTGTLDLIYRADSFGADETKGLMVKVPGSWRDKLATY